MTQRIPIHDATRDTEESPTSHAMYAKRRHLYVREVHGLFQRLRRGSNWLLMVLYFGLPWVNWGDRPLILFDLPAREFHLFTATFYPQEFILLAWLLILCAFGLFLITVFAGRVWCGYTCPQSVWTLLFIWFEHRLEGPRHRRIRRDQRPWDLDTLWRKATKHGAWLGIAAATGVTFVGYFTPIRQLVTDLAQFGAGGWALFWIGFFTLFTYLNAGWLREQVCLHMCPYARFQSVMFDADTLIVSYDRQRGEPRGRQRVKGPSDAATGGDCIDCELCVQVCPTGIDIRDGLQYECIGCAACVDACDSIMTRIGAPRGLIRYTTEHALAGHTTRILRPRLLGYLAALMIMIGLMVGYIGQRVPLELEVERDRQQLYQLTREGRVSNRYTLTLRNQDDRPHTYRLGVTGLPGLTLTGPDERWVAAETTTTWIIELTADPAALVAPSQPIELHLSTREDTGIRQHRETRFLGPAR
ncbi:cytochrome c oxidase accessory protein CcoG [Bisbaumannia pacifica]|uniref:Cytochrome c oxidase accessory protein CcoG n=1 Tax=Bisbaumannia pacifica TaxID=77098 RepID=A0A510X907_9GAMM|nr:cytochrome c oxidase accessory protein CcoG [Halomonas pacifica]MBH8579776.1 cytochrome c oxidase accessory protein CcoG [Halomonas pacifica]GEK46965.1 ferredoxin [Halomonas pacifica]